jgi:protein-disulfide isomerase
VHRILKSLVLAACVAAALPSLAGAQGTTPQTLSREQIEQIVREYLLANPVVIIEAVEGLEEKRRREAEAGQRDALKAKQAQIFNDPDAPVAGNPQGDVTLVEFFDYRCGYCKQVAPALAQLLKSDSKLRFVFKELPILGPDSIVAARGALAARLQDKYVPMHEALIRHRGSFDEQTVLRIASEVGLDVALLKADMAKPELNAIIEKNRQLARDLAINGTPAFVIGDKVIPGAVDLNTLRKLVADARQR